jgi:uncharacterized protein
MLLSQHAMPSRLFDALAGGGGGPEAIRKLVAAQLSKHLILLQQVFASGRHAAPRQAGQTRRGWDLLTEVQHHDRAAAEALIQYPSVGAWALRTVLVAQGAPAVTGAEPNQLSAVAAAAAIRARMPAEIEVPVAGGAVMLPSLGAVAATGPAAVIHIGSTGTYVLSAGKRVDIPGSPEQDAPGWQGLRRISAGSLDVPIDDLDPFRMPETDDLAPRLSVIEASRWNRDFQQAWLLLETDHPTVAAEVREIVSVIVPLKKPPDGQVSCSSPQASGAAALSEPPDPYSCAVTLAHEVQHQKLSALLDIVELARPDTGRRYYAPWRDDPRPLNGLLQGAYAHLGVSSFWRGHRRSADSAIRLRANAEFARWRTAAGRAVGALLASGQLTAAGSRFARGMECQLKAWCTEPVPAEAQSIADRAAEAHLARWQLVNGPIPH